MNKDIQTLIEREAEDIASKSLYPDKITNITVYSKACVNNYFKAGAHFALSLFKWRKVSEVLPEEDDCRCSLPVLIKNKYNTYRVARYSYKYNDFVIGETSISGVIEWMPIPQID